MLHIQYSEIAVKQLKTIARSDKQSALLILTKIEQYAKDPKSITNLKILKGKLATFKRIRAGNFRIIFDTENNVLNIYQIKHRKEAYK